MGSKVREKCKAFNVVFSYMRMWFFNDLFLSSVKSHVIFKKKKNSNVTLWMKFYLIVLGGILLSPSTCDMGSLLLHLSRHRILCNTTFSRLIQLGTSQRGSFGWPQCATWVWSDKGFTRSTMKSVNKCNPQQDCYPTITLI